jgi:hypothetical protein
VMPSAPPGLRLLVASDTIWHEGLTRCTTAKVSAHVSCRPVPMRASHVDLGQGPREEEQRLAWSGSLSTYLRARAVADRLPHRPPASQIRTGVRRFSPRHCCTLLLYQTLEPLAQVFELLSLSWCGAMGIRTPDLLHAIQRQHVHRSPSVQVTVSGRPHQSPGIQAGCCTFVLYGSARPPVRTERAPLR